MSEPRRSADTGAAGGSADGRFYESSGGTSGEVHRVGVRVPPFYPQKPSLWFSQLESQFVLANITTEATKFHYTLGSLDPMIAAEVEDIVADPDMTNKYTRLKTELIKRLSASREKKVMQLLTREELGDRKPSQFLRHLKQLAGPDVPEGFMRTIWASRLPTNVQSIIASQVKKPVDEVAELADSIIDVVQPTPQVASTSGAGTSYDSPASMSGQIAELTRLVHSLQTKIDRMSRPRDRSSSRNRRRSSSTRSQSNYRKHPICFYHNKYGSKANRCVKPCDYAGNDRGSR